MEELIEKVDAPKQEEKQVEDGKIYSRAIVNEILETVSTKIQTNNLEEFKSFIEGDETDIKNYINAIQYSYNLDLNIYKQDDEGNIQQVNPSIVFEELLNL
mgnify:CR=1 FL=1